MSTVIAIGLDSAEPRVMEQWIRDGKLPTMQRIANRGVYGRLDNSHIYSAETPWTTFATGVKPERTGYYSPLRYHVDRYEVGTRAAYEYDEFPPFFALGSDYRVCAFDLPQVRLIDPDKFPFSGVQVACWGAHSPQVSPGSNPPGLYEELVRKHGEHPALHRDYAVCVDIKGTMRLESILNTGIERRAAICEDLLRRERWDLFTTVFGESHAAGHNFWQLSQPDHPLYEKLHRQVDHDPMLTCFQAMDTAIARIVDAAPDDAVIVVFSAHGMGPNTMDLPSGGFLPELLHRYSFQGEAALAEGDIDAPVPDHITELDWCYWERHVWNTKVDSHPLRKFLRRKLPTRALALIEDWLEKGSRLRPPVSSARKHISLSFQPAKWYEPLWPQMKAFALPSFSEGYVRINVKGREPQGMVDASDYHRVCDEVTELIERMRCSRTGVPMAAQIVRTRENPMDTNPKLPDADLVVVWQEEYAADAVDVPGYGRIGPVPHYRAGSHRPEGFLMACGDQLPVGAQLAERGHAVQIAPTILELMGAPIPDHFDGEPLPLHRTQQHAVS